jgi:flavin-dependent dehydrogenase
MGRSLSRDRLDRALSDAAAAAGAVLRMGTEATVAAPCPGGRQVLLRRDGHLESTSARVVLVATGLGSPGLDPALPIRRQARPGARVGAGCRVSADAAGTGYGRGTIHMAIGRHGYVGLVRTEAGDLNLAAAFDRAHLPAAAGVLAEAGFEPVPPAAAGGWRATPALTRRSTPPAAERLLLLGDAAGYVEPFTGEGMGWALIGALAVVPSVLQGQGDWSREIERQWARRHGRLIGSRQRLCHGLAFALRRPGLSRGLLALAERWPGLIAPVLHHLEGASLEPLGLEP